MSTEQLHVVYDGEYIGNTNSMKSILPMKWFNSNY